MSAIIYTATRISRNKRKQVYETVTPELVPCHHINLFEESERIKEEKKKQRRR